MNTETKIEHLFDRSDICKRCGHSWEEYAILGFGCITEMNNVHSIEHKRFEKKYKKLVERMTRK